MKRLKDIEEYALNQQDRILSETARVRKEYEKNVEGYDAEREKKLEENVKQEKILEATRDEMQRKSLELRQQQLDASKEQSKALKFLAADARSKAKKAGRLKPAPLNIPGQISYAAERVTDAVSLKSDIGKEEGRV